MVCPPAASLKDTGLVLEFFDQLADRSDLDTSLARGRLGGGYHTQARRDVDAEIIRGLLVDRLDPVVERFLWSELGDVEIEIVVLDEMPLNATGKVDRVRLKKMAAGEIAVSWGSPGPASRRPASGA